MTKPFRLVLLCLLPLAVFIAACSDRPAQSDLRNVTETATSAGATPGATSAATPAPLPEGLRKILENVAKVRGLPAPLELKASLIARSELPALLDRLLTAEDRQDMDRLTTLYRLLGHLQRDQDYYSVYQDFGGDSILGLYSPVDDELWVVHDDGDEPDFENLPRQEHETLAHEFVHALQDYHFKLDEVYRRVKDDLDRSGAFTSVVEGDAVTYERIYTREYLRLPGSSAFVLFDTSRAVTADVPPSIARELLFPYTTGAEWIRTIRERSGQAAIDAMVKSPPRGTAYILHPELLDNGFQPASVTLPNLESTLGSNWKRESGGSFGEFQVRNYLQLRLRAADASSAADGWIGDHYDVYSNGSASVGAFRVAFRTSEEATEFANRHRELLEASRATSNGRGAVTYWEIPGGNVAATVAVSGNEVLFIIGSERAVTEKAAQALVNG